MSEKAIKIEKTQVLAEAIMNLNSEDRTINFDRESDNFWTPVRIIEILESMGYKIIEENGYGNMRYEVFEKAGYPYLELFYNCQHWTMALRMWEDFK